MQDVQNKLKNHHTRQQQISLFENTDHLKHVNNINISAPAPSPIFTFIDLFAGIGGFYLALNAVGGKCVFAAETNRYCIDVYQKKFNILAAGDITKIEPAIAPVYL